MKYRRTRSAFRHDNRIARTTSVLSAAAMAALLILGSGPAFADDAPVDGGSTASTEAPTPEPDPAPAPDPAPEPDPAPAPDPAPPEPATPPAADPEPPAPSGGDDTPAPSTDAPAPSTDTPAAPETVTDEAAAAEAPKTFHTALSALLAAALASQCDAQHSPILIGTFEMDGNTCLDDLTKDDWDDTGIHKDDGIKDNTAYTQGASENDAPGTWADGGSSNGKDDITDAWSYTEVIGGQVWTFFAMHRDANNGTTTYDLELNKLDNTSSTPARPNRSIGDLLLQFDVNGTGPLLFESAYEWTAEADFNDPECFEADNIGFGWCPLSTVAPPDFHSRVSDDGLFAEGALNLSALADANGELCSGTFGQANMRTVASNEHTAALQDYVDAFDVKIDSSCGSIVINKTDEATGLPVGGAKFTISPDPTPGSNAPGPIVLVDGGAGDSDNTANGVITIDPAQAGLYTVVETDPPPGYLKPAVTEKELPLASGATEVATFNFADPKAWEPLTASKTAIPGYTATYNWSVLKEIAKTANGPWVGDTAPDPGQLVKKVDPNDPDAGKLFYRVTANEVGTPALSDYEVHGVITVNNPNSANVAVTLGDSLPGGTCTIEGSTPPLNTTAVPGSNEFDYSCDLGDAPDPANITGEQTNTASVKWDISDYPQGQPDVGKDGDYELTPTDKYTFGDPTINVNKTVTLSDDQTDALDGVSFTWGVDLPHVSPVYSTSHTTEVGECTDVIVNTVTLKGTGDATLDTDSAYGQICNPYTQISVQKVDYETGDALAGAEFTLYDGDTELGTATSGVDGIAVFDNKLFPGTYTVKETGAPPGYSLPLDGQDTVTVTIDPIDAVDSNFVENGVMPAIVFRDPAQGELAITKEHYERDPATNDWVVSDGAVDFGEEIRYVMDIEADGPRLFHDVTVTDYVPGFNPDDVTSTGVGTYEGGTAACGGDFTCDISVDEGTGKITWVLHTGALDAGEVKGEASGTVEFVVRMTQLPDEPPFDANGIFSVLLWNQAQLDWTQQELTVVSPPPVDARTNAIVDGLVPHTLLTNEVTDEARAIETTPPPPPCQRVNPPKSCNPPPLPPTGGPSIWFLVLGLGLALGGVSLVVSDRRHRRRS